MSMRHRHERCFGQFVFVPRGKIRQYPCGKVIIRTGLLPTPELDAGKGIAAGEFNNTFNAVMTAVTAFSSNTQKAGFQRDVVIYYNHVFDRNFVKTASPLQ